MKQANATQRARFRAHSRALQQAMIAQKERAWNPTTYRVCPPRYLGLKPVFGAREEPWSRDAAIYAAKTGRCARTVGGTCPLSAVVSTRRVRWLCVESSAVVDQKLCMC